MSNTSLKVKIQYRNFSKANFSVFKQNIEPVRHNRRSERLFIVFYIHVVFSIQFFQEWSGNVLFRCQLILNLSNSLFSHRINAYFLVLLLVYIQLIDCQIFLKKGKAPSRDLVEFNLPAVGVFISISKGVGGRLNSSSGLTLHTV